MADWTALNSVTILTAATAAGEAVALLIGVRLIGEPGNPWISTKNDLILPFYFALGLPLTWMAWRRPRALTGSARSASSSTRPADVAKDALHW